MGKNWKTAATVVGVLLIVAMIVWYMMFPYVTAGTAVFTVTDKERVVRGDGDSVSSYYLVFTEDRNGKSETFSNVDTLMYWKFNSSDLQGSLKIGRTYMADVYGWRVPFLSWYRNIVNVRQVDPGQATAEAAS